MIVAGTLRIDDGQSQKDVPLFTGETYVRLAGIKHDVQNASPHAISFVEIEIKRPALLFGKADEAGLINRRAETLRQQHACRDEGACRAPRCLLGPHELRAASWDSARHNMPAPRFL